MAGSLPKNWLSPGGTYTVTKAKTTTVTGSVTGGVDAEFSSYVKGTCAIESINLTDCL